MHKYCSFLLGILLAPSATCGLVAQSPPTVRVENPTAFGYSGWVHSTVPIAPGVIPVANTALLDSVALLDPATHAPLPSVAWPIKWHWQNGRRASVALAAVRTRLQLPAGSAADYDVALNGQPVGDFVLHGNIQQWILGQHMGEDVFLLARFVGDPEVYVARPLGQDRELQRNGASLVIRGRTRFTQMRNPAVRHALTLTTYWNLQANESHGTVTVMVGNDTLERPVSGGIRIEELVLVHQLPFAASPRIQATAGVQGPVYFGNYVGWSLLRQQAMGDGQEYAVDFAFSVTNSMTSPEFVSMLAEANAPLVGIADAASWRASQAAGPVGYVPPPRFPSLTAARAQLAIDSIPRLAQPGDDLAIVNRNPPGTGDQPDFMSNIPLFYLQAVQTGSSSPLSRAIVGAKRESWRPTNYWEVRNGKAERVSLRNYPDLFLWNGRPHFDPSWNLQYPQWTNRAAGFNAGDFGGWAGMDSQHFGHNGVRSVYELTADAYLAELLQANLSIVYWDYFTDWMGSTEAERAGRMMKEAILLSSLFPDAPESVSLQQAVRQKLGVFVSTATFFFGQYHFPAIASVRDDPRVPLTQQFPGQDVHMSWQTGFHMEAVVLASKILGDANANLLIQFYLDNANLLFEADGTPRSYTLMSNPTFRATGGIGIAWWSGWVLADRMFPGNRNRAMFDQFEASLRQALAAPNGQWWWGDDRWRCFP